MTPITIYPKAQGQIGEKIKKSEFMKSSSELLLAVSRKDFAELDELLRSGISPNNSTRYGYSAFANAIIEKNFGIAELLLSFGGDVNWPMKDGRTCLHYAAKLDDSAMTEWLIIKGASINPIDSFGNTPLWYACSNWFRHPNSGNVELLLRHSADISIINNYGVGIKDFLSRNGEGFAEVLKAYFDNDAY